MKSNKYLMVTALIAILILSGCSKADKELDESTINKTPENVTTTRMSEKEFAAEENKVVELTDDLDLQGCNSLKSANLQQLCKINVNYKLAETKLDDSYCQEIAENTLKEDCLAMVSVLRSKAN